jgi:NTP pyrophosphatase (non-canonical NTP hydrolase)
MDLKAKATRIHKHTVAVGWWDEYPDRSHRHDIMIMWAISEFGEAFNGHRRQCNDDRLTEWPQFDVELADVAIILLDLAGAYNISFSMFHMGELASSFRRYLHGSSVSAELNRAVKFMLDGNDREQQVLRGLAAVITVANRNGVNIDKLIDLKQAYNEHRVDHKRGNQKKAG